MHCIIPTKPKLKKDFLIQVASSHIGNWNKSKICVWKLYYQRFLESLQNKIILESGTVWPE